MHIGYSSPSSITFSVTGTGASIVNDVAGLTDGLPDQATRFTFVSGTQTTSSAVKIQGTFSAATPIGGCGIFSTTLPAGTLIKIYGKRPADSGYTYNLGGNSQTQRVTTRDCDGKNVCIWQFADGLDAISAFEITIYNDVNGSASIAASSYFDIGEIFPAPRFYIDHDASPSDDLQPNAAGRSSKTLQPWPVLYAAGRVDKVTVSAVPYDLAKGTPASGVNLIQLRAAISQGQTCMVGIFNNTTALDTHQLQHDTMLAICTTFNPVLKEAGPNYGTGMTFSEIPG